MLPLCLAAAALKLTRPPSLSHAEVDQLVAQRTRLRSVRDFAAADALKETLESAGVRLQDEVRGRVDMYAVPRSAPAAEGAAPCSTAVAAGCSTAAAVAAHASLLAAATAAAATAVPAASSDRALGSQHSSSAKGRELLHMLSSWRSSAAAAGSVPGSSRAALCNR